MVDVIVPTNAVCDKMLPNNLPWDKYTDSQICAGGADKDACQGKDFTQTQLEVMALPVVDFSRQGYKIYEIIEF